MPARFRVLALLTCFLFLSFAFANAANVAVYPASATLSPGQSLSFSAAVVGGANMGVVWSMSPAVGKMNNGFYTAPATISSPQTVVLTAASLGNAGITGTAVISLMPITAAPAPISTGPLTLSPTVATISAGQTANFTALYNGSPTNQVNWTVNPAIGSIDNGVYQAPVAIATSRTVTVTAVSFLDSTVLATATVSLIGANGAAPVGAGSVFVFPSSVTLTAGQGMSFQAGVTGAANAGVSWSLSPPVGTISNGHYQAPSSIPYSQTVMLTATSLANPSLSSSAPIFLVGSSPAPSTPVIPTQPTSSTSMQLSPTSISLSSQQAAVFTVSTTGGLSTAATWSVVPNMGSVSNGVYTAPSAISTQTMVTVIATSMANPSMNASAVVMLQPNSTPASNVSISLSPSSVNLSSGQTTQFTPSVTGTSNTSVTWTVSPALGSVSSGQYTAPSSVANQQAVTVTATSVADPSKSASAIVMLMPSAVTLSPQSISLAAGKSVQFSASVTGPSNTAVSWSISPAVGSISNGLYTAPSSVSTSQNVVVTATSVGDPTKSAQATISLTASGATGILVSPASVSLAASQGQQFSATSSGIGGGGLASVSWSLNPAVGSITSGGFYSAPSSISTQQTVVVTATSSGATATANVTLMPASTPPPSQPPTTPPSTPPSSTTITLPLEVVGPNGTTVAASFTVGSGANLGGATTLSMQIHGLRFDGQASVQVNGSGWLTIANSTVTFQGLGGNYGGIGGGFHTLQMTMPLAANVVTTGTNTITFKFNGTDGNVSGFRVLGFNVNDASGTPLISSSNFVWVDPNTWQPPSTAASDISAGQTLWHTASLLNSSGQPLQAHCADCHSEDGRDLKYFNYSNNSIVARSQFHGLTQQQGNQIASYIRSLNAPNPGTPWNPPYQPGPGMDSQPVSNWSAGAGLSAVLDTDAEMQQYLEPGGSTAGWAANQYLNPRELPISLQLLDWNSWLPPVAPVDAYGSGFTTSTAYTDYLQLRTVLQPNSTTAYKNAMGLFDQWMEGVNQTFMSQIEPSTYTQATRQSVYAVAQWQMVKQWELNQEFGLEAMPQVPFGSKANVRGWYGSNAFNTSPNILHMPAGPGLGNGSAVVATYLAFIWYQTQLILNDGQGQQGDNRPIDYGYVIAMIRPLSNQAASPNAYLLATWFVKCLQEETSSHTDPSTDWSPTWTTPEAMIDGGYGNVWGGTPASTMTSIIQNYANAWFAQISKYTQAQFIAGGWATGTDDPGNNSTDFFETSAGGEVWWLLPWLRYYGIPASFTTEVAAWAAQIWPAGNWALNNAATCVLATGCTSGF